MSGTKYSVTIMTIIRKAEEGEAQKENGSFVAFHSGTRGPGSLVKRFIERRRGSPERRSSTAIAETIVKRLYDYSESEETSDCLWGQ